MQARVRPLMSRQIESSHVGVSRGVSEETTASSDEHVRESVSRPSGRVVSAIGAVLKRPHSQVGVNIHEKKHFTTFLSNFMYVYFISNVSA